MSCEDFALAYEASVDWSHSNARCLVRNTIIQIFWRHTLLRLDPFGVWDDCWLLWSPYHISVLLQEVVLFVISDDLTNLDFVIGEALRAQLEILRRVHILHSQSRSIHRHAIILANILGSLLIFFHMLIHEEYLFSFLLQAFE